ncbi:MAG: hypothetical protein GX617_16840 [Lentisphaerae bacterium]|nr:hypothetical protein [Lentisphaerota bacterium]
MRKTSLLLLSLLTAALTPGLLHAQRHPMPPDLKLSSGIDMRGGPLRRASRVEADLVKVGSDSFTSLADITTPVYAAIVSATNAALAAANSYADGATNATLTAANSYADTLVGSLRVYTDGTNLFFVTDAFVTNIVTITQVD